MYDVCSGCDNKINPSARPRARARALETTRRRVGNTEREDKRQKTKRQRGFPACSQASTNAPQAGLSSLFRWGRLIFCWCERLMEDRARGVCIIMTTCIGRDTLMGHFRTTREHDASGPHRASPGRSPGRSSLVVRSRLGPTRARWIRARWGASSSSSSSIERDDDDDDERDDDDADESDDDACRRRRRARTEA